MLLLVLLSWNSTSFNKKRFGREQSDGSQAFEDGRDTWVQNSARDPRAVTPPDGRFPMHNATNVKFEAPKVPVIFVLGGPGSGKVTHCDSLMQEKSGVTHINMTDLLQQYAVGNDMQDFGMLSSKTVTEVLMLEMKMAPTAKTYLVSGYPRNMRDVVEYSEKINTINGVILISWRQKVLERQIDYGAKLGQVVLSLAKMELNNFYKNVMPVADYFDQSNMLIAVNGERHPGDVYKDFRSSVFRILGEHDNPPVFGNGRIASVPDDVSSELPTRSTQTVTVPQPGIRPAGTTTTTTGAAAAAAVAAVGPRAGLAAGASAAVAAAAAATTAAQAHTERPSTQIISVTSNQPANYRSPVKPGWPPVLWVIGGPGSNKAALCTQVAKDTGWSHISMGKLLRAAAEPPDPRPGSDAAKIRDSIAGGEMVPLDIVMRMVESHMGSSHTNNNGVILDGFPRDMTQAVEFENKFKQKPTIILLDCSKLQLGRGRLDDSVTAFRRRLEIFRQSSLPMLKAMDNIGRLTIVDGDTDTSPVQEDFTNVVREHIEYMREHAAEQSLLPQQPVHQAAPSGAAARKSMPNGNIAAAAAGRAAMAAEGPIPIAEVRQRSLPEQGRANADGTTLQDLESEASGTIDTISRQVVNGVVKQGQAAANAATKIANGHMKNGFAGNKFASLDAERQNNIRQMYSEVEGHI